MPLHLSPMQEEDIPAFAIVDCAAMANNGLAQAMDMSRTGGEPRRQMVERWTRQRWRNVNDEVWVKVTDSDTDELIAAAFWIFRPGQKKPEDVPAVSTTDANGREEAEMPPILAVMAEQSKKFRDDFIGPRPHANLSILVTHPKHQRRGAGSMLVKFGCDKADERGIVSYLTASQAGLSVYLKHGFEIVQESPLDLRPYGIDETEIRLRMIRQPKTLLRE